MPTMPDNTSQTRTQATLTLDLADPRTPFWTQRLLYDVVTRMYLDAWSDSEVATALNAEYDTTLSGGDVHGIRREAAIAAEVIGSRDIRRNWIYRYHNLTINNLVKEYMFLEDRRDFLEAKKLLAAEVEQLVNATPEHRIWIAVNDALGRNNIDYALIRALVAYSKMCRRLELMVRAYADRNRKAIEDAMEDVSQKVNAYFSGPGEKDLTNTAQFATALLDRTYGTVTEQGVHFLREYCRFARLRATQTGELTQRIMQGADVTTRPFTPLELILRGTEQSFSVDQVQHIIGQLREGRVRPPDQLSVIIDYVHRHLRYLEMRERITGCQDTTQRLRRGGLDRLDRAAADHMGLTSAGRFFTGRELARATRNGVAEGDLDILLARLNYCASKTAVTEEWHAIAVKRPDIAGLFRPDTYLRRRYGKA